MKRLASVLAVMAALAGSMYAQDVVSSFKVTPTVSGVPFYVDGVEYRSAAVFLWPKGSKHELVYKGNQENGTWLNEQRTHQYTFGGWSVDGGAAPVGGGNAVTVTADPTVTGFIATFTVSYRVNLVIMDGGTSTPTCGSPGDLSDPTSRAGVVYVGGGCYWNSATIYLPAGTVSLSAYPFPGFVFSGWSVNLGPTDGFLRTFDVKGPITLTPVFSPGKRVRFLTSPIGRQLLIDRTEIRTPSQSPCIPSELQVPAVPNVHYTSQDALCLGEFDFATNSQHLLSAPSPQLDATGNLFVFDSWSIGGGQNTVYTAKDINVPQTIIGNFVPGARVSFVTTPTVLKLSVDGRDNWPSYNFVWAIGAKYTVTAPAEQFDAKGRKYVFKGWSNGGPATQDVVVDPNALANGGMRLTANYELLNRAVIGGTVPGLTAKVDGVDCLTPCSVDRANGATVRVSVPATISLSDSSRYDFTVWQDGGPADRILTLNKDYQTVNANYRVSNRLIAACDPDGGSDFRFDPPSADGFYASDATVTVTATAKPGYHFRRWDGDLSGTFRSGLVPMSVPRAVRAMLDRVPYIAPAGVKNAAGDTPVDGVAAGSMISIYGASLATRSETGPASPLAQSLAGSVVLVGDRLLPLIYVSPEQINAQLPGDLPEGGYNLMVKNDGLPDITAQFTVVRNAPGLFSSVVGDKHYAVALHADGSAISVDSPAKRNEVITLLGTGFGPFSRTVPDGFAIPASPATPLADSAEIVAGSLRLQPTFTGAAPGFVGVAASKLRITSDLPGASSVEIRISVNGQESNTVLLPIE